ncbi:MAG: T9SS type A sorting domain-containing protein [Bacteroidetes bacterium]|nr:T9SS type A sorting domain-containing protein [Bacteroidota bacterium]
MKQFYTSIRLFLVLFLLTQAGRVNAQSNQYLDFDGVDDYVNVPNASALIAGSNAITITGWFYDNQLAYGQGMMGFRGTNGGFYMIELNNGQIECRLLNSAGTLYTYNAPNYTIVPQVWQHYAWVYNGSTIALYLNGNLLGSTAASGTITSTAISFAIGKSLLGGFNFVYSGRADEVSVWNKALSQSEIQDMMTNELTGTEANLKLYYKFNQGVPAGNNTSITSLISSLNSPTYDGQLLNFALTGATSNFNGTLNTSFQAISFPQIPTQLTTNAPFALGATASSGLPVSYSIESGPATVNGSTITLTGPGTVSVRASQLGNAQYDSATSVVNVFDVVDPAVNAPIIEARNPLDGSNVYMPTLSTMELAALVSIDYSGLFSVASVDFSIGGNPLSVNDHGNGHYTALWAPTSYGAYTIQMTATSNFGAVSTQNININVVNTASDLSNQVAFSGVWLNTDSNSVTRDGILPSYVGAYDTIIATLTVTCPSGGCGPWDRVASIDARGHDGEWYEIIRYITPYGVPCSHRINLTDYQSLLQGKVEFRANCSTLDNGFLYELKFDFKEGAPQYKYSSVIKVWKEIYPFGDLANLQPVQQFNYSFPSHTVAAKLKLVSTGHGWGNLNTGNAAEFYNATHTIQVNGNNTFSQHNWSTCNPNPDACSPQSGTWTYNRAGWCPGSIAPYFDYDMTSFVATQNIDLNYQFYTGYQDLCHPNNPNCITGTTCTDCTDGFNPTLDVNCNMIVFYDTAVVNTVKEIDQIGLAVYPNPSTGFFTISSASRQGQTYQVVVYDMMGKVAKSFTWYGERRAVDLTSFTKGVYLVRATNGKSVEYKKVVIE